MTPQHNQGDNIKNWLLSRIKKILRLTNPARKLQINRSIAFHGSQYGGWTLCPDGLSNDSVVYSFGIGEDASFDQSVIETYGAEVYAFDPTPGSIEWVEGQTWPAQFHFYPYGIAAENGILDFHPPDNPNYISHTLLDRAGTRERIIQVEVRKLTDLVKFGGHTRIDVLKMDVEGAEYQVIPDLLNQDQVEIQQILVEFHDFFPEISRREKKKTIRLLNYAGYRIFHVSPSGQEYSFLKTG